MRYTPRMRSAFPVTREPESILHIINIINH